MKSDGFVRRRETENIRRKDFI